MNENLLHETGSVPICMMLLGGARLLGETLALALGADSEVRPSGWFNGSQELADKAKESNPSVVLIQVPGALAEAATMIADLAGLLPKSRLLAYGGDFGDDAVLTLIESGACAYLPRDSTFKAVLSTVKAVQHGTVAYSPKLIALVLARIRALSDHKPASPERERMLTEREKEVMQLISRGLGNKDIARRLGVSTSTAKNHVHALLRKLNTHRRRDAIIKAYEAEVLTSSFSQIEVAGD